MNFLLEVVAKYLLKGMGPINGYKTVVGLGIAVLSYIAKAFFDVEVPVLGSEMTEFIGMIVAAFGLGDKGRKVIDGQTSGKAI